MMAAVIHKSYEQKIIKIAESSLRFDNNMYRIGIPWRVEDHTLTNNYKMALRRLSNTEKRLEKSPDIAAAYNEIIGQYIVKGYTLRKHAHVIYCNFSRL